MHGVTARKQRMKRGIVTYQLAAKVSVCRSCYMIVSELGIAFPANGDCLVQQTLFELHICEVQVVRDVLCIRPDKPFTLWAQWGGVRCPVYRIGRGIACTSSLTCRLFDPSSTDETPAVACRN